MKLISTDKKILRKKVESLLLNVKEGEKIHLDKDILEELLFDKYLEKSKGWAVKFYDVKESILVKYLTWSGDFLQKIDLSEISFDNVMWDVNYYEEKNTCFEVTSNRYEGVNSINLANTNAHIDFTTSSFGNTYNELCISISNCNFANVDLSNNILRNEWYIINNSDFSNTGLQIDFDKNNLAYLENCNLSGLDFSKYTVNSYHFILDDQDVGFHSENCNFANTGIRIFTRNSENESELYKEKIDSFRNMLKKGYLNGCYINDKLITTKEARKERAEQERRKYLEFSNNIFESVQEQINKKSL